MRILITAGGTREKIDDVRGITNFSTGRLGSLIADEFAKDSSNVITYIHGVGSQRPVSGKIEMVTIESVGDLLDAVTDKLSNYRFDVIIHSMAVSDYYVAGLSEGSRLVEELSKDVSNQEHFDTIKREERIRETFDRVFSPISGRTKKLSSHDDSVYLQLKAAPKVIGLFKKEQPEALLVGFKLLVNVTQEELLGVAEKLMDKNQCDYIVANDKKLISGDQHIAHLLDCCGVKDTYKTKQDIARGLYRLFNERMK